MNQNWFVQLTGLTLPHPHPDAEDELEKNIPAIAKCVKFDEFIFYTERLKSFDAWPEKFTGQEKLGLSMAGFFYTQKDYIVICFCCGKKLHWKEWDDPWEQHALANEHCPYLLMVKGSDYIALHKLDIDLSTLFV